MSPWTPEEHQREMKTLIDEGRAFGADAVFVAAGELPVVNDPNVLQAIEEHNGVSVALAAHRAGDYCAVFLVMKRSDGPWLSETVLVHGGAVESSMGRGGIRSRSEAEPGKPVVDARGGSTVGTREAVVFVSGVSVDESVRLRWENEIVAETTVAGHGYFALAAVVPHDADSGRLEPSRAVLEGC